MNKRRFSPRSRAENERMVQRSESYWGKGLITDFEETPQGALTGLENTIDYVTELRGRKGSVLYNYGMVKVVVDTGVSFGEALANGDLDDVINGTGYFIVYNDDDYTGDTLAGEKRLVETIDNKNGSEIINVRAFDIYKYTNSDGLSYIGNLSLPVYLDNNWGSYSDADAVGHYLYINDTFYEIESYDSSEYIYNNGESSVPVGELNIAFRPSSSYYDEQNRVMIAHIGTYLFYSYLPHKGWHIIPLTSNTPLTLEYGNFSQQGNDIIFSNPSGIYRIRVSSENIYGWKINENSSSTRITADDIKVFALSSDDGSFPQDLIDKYEDYLYELSGVATEDAEGNVFNDGGVFIE